MITLPALLAGTLTACDGDNPPPPAKLATTGEVAFLYGAYQIAKKASIHTSILYIDTAFAAEPRCDNSNGSTSFTPSTEPPNTFDGVAVFNQCQRTLFAGTILASGQIAGKCGSGDDPANCNMPRQEPAGGANGSKTFDFDITDNASSPKVDTSWKIKGVFPLGPSNYQDQDGTVIYSDNLDKYGIAKFGFKVVFDHIDILKTEGNFSVAATPKGCPSGSVSASSDPANPNIITLESAIGETATVVVNPDSTVKVTLADGTTKTYSNDALNTPQQFCADAVLP